MFHTLIVGVLREVYTSIIGDTVEELYRHEKFPNKPDISEVLSEFDATFNDTEGYGQRLSALWVRQSSNARGAPSFLQMMKINGAVTKHIQKQIDAKTTWRTLVRISVSRSDEE